MVIGLNPAQAHLTVDDTLYFLVKVDHAAENFIFKNEYRSLEYTTMNKDFVSYSCSSVVYMMTREEQCELIGVYKHLEEKKKIFRDQMIKRGLNIDDNWVIIKRIE